MSVPRRKSRSRSRLLGWVPFDTWRVPSANVNYLRIIGTLLCKTSSHPSERGSQRLSIVSRLSHILTLTPELCLGHLGIGCAGELQLTPHDDYEKWAITILVKFRDTEQLQQLTAHRQSGGVCLSSRPRSRIGMLTTDLMYSQERSLTTILYLMSMTECARAPFSLVDEINQVSST